MKSLHLSQLFKNLFFGICFSFFGIYAALADDTKAEAINLELDTSLGGYLGKIGEDPNATWDDVDIYKFTTTTAGNLNFKIITQGDLRIVGPYLQNSSDTRGLNMGGTYVGGEAGEYNCFHNHLKPGTYYCLVNRWTGNYNSGAYSITVQFTPSEYEDDGDNNETFQTSKRINIGEEYTGNIAFKDENHAWDKEDWYKIVLDKPAVIDLKYSCLNHEIRNWPYFILKSKHRKHPSRDEFVYNTLAQFKDTANLKSFALDTGTYYLNVYLQYDYFNSYKFAVNAKYVDDIPSRNHPYFKSSYPLKPNDNLTDLLGYTNGIIGNTKDYYKLTVPEDGTFRIRMVTKEGLNMGSSFTVFKDDTSRTIRAFNYQANVSGNSYRDYNFPDSIYAYYALAKGNYYIQVMGGGYWGNENYGSYNLRTSFSKSAFIADIEPNKFFKDAISIQLNDSVTGQMGYQTNINTFFDTYDNFKIDVPKAGKLLLRAKTDSTLNISCILYARDSVKQIATINPFGSDTILQDLAKGQYFIRIFRQGSSSFGGYALISEFTPVSEYGDVEPNDFANSAFALTKDELTHGSLAYSDGLISDEVDWYKVTTASNSQTNIRVEGENITVEFFDSDTIAKMWQNVSQSADTFLLDKVSAVTTFYVKITPTGKTVYNIVWSNTLPYYANDEEVNNDADNAIDIDLNVIYTGNIGYPITAELKDEEDWYKLVLPFDGSLYLKSKNHGDGANFTLINAFNKTDAVASQNKYYFTDTLRTVHFRNLSKGTYYIKANGWSPSSYLFWVEGSEAEVQEEIPSSNDWYSHGTPIKLNEQKWGLIGYTSGSYADKTDFYTFSISEEDSLAIKVDCFNELRIFGPAIYDMNGNMIVQKGYWSAGKNHLIQKTFAAGTYSVEIQRNHERYFGHYAIQIMPYESVGVADVNDSKLKLHPNPFRNRISIQIDPGKNYKTIEVYHINGRLVYKANVDKINDELNTSSWQNGAYILRLSGNGEPVSRKMIKR